MRPEEWTKEDLQMTMQLERITAENATRQMQRIRDEDIRLYEMQKKLQKERMIYQEKEHQRELQHQEQKHKKQDWFTYSVNMFCIAVFVCLSVFFFFHWFQIDFKPIVRLFGFNIQTSTLSKNEGWLQMLVPNLALLVGYIVLRFGMTTMPFEVEWLSKPPKEKQMFLFVPVFAAVSLLLQIITKGLQNILEKLTNYQAPPELVLAKDGISILLIFVFFVLLPAWLSEYFFRGGLQKLLEHWGIIFSITVSSLISSMLCADLAAMPSIFLTSFLLGLFAYWTKSIYLCIWMHFSANFVMFLFYSVVQFMDGVESFAFTIYLIMMVLVLGVACFMIALQMKLPRLFQPMPNIQEFKHKHTKTERLFRTPLFVVLTIVLAFRVIKPLF